ncbi:MAG: TRAP transporter large permease [Armatimonadota bacterium]|nr:TRAP transporter large permease [Armatimonadota bacterium]MDR7519286.1 TRAP transporter large permease [Armatimonadota bacterium]MDR7551201.1 TRAP transporter large permease [Armatimonadota bacterium]
MEKWILLGVVAVGFASGLPVAFALGLGCAVYMLLVGTIDITIVAQRMIFGIDSFLLLAVPFFILAAEVMNTTGTTRRIFQFAHAVVGHVPGGLAHVNVVNSMIFAGMSGSAIADAAGVGMMEVEAMEGAGYPRPFAAALSAATSTIGPIIPPSIPMVIYGSMAQVSVGALFLGGVIPGAIMGLAMMGLVYLQAVRRGFPREARVTFREFLTVFWKAIPPLLAPAILLGGIYTGFFTPTEAAAVAVLYALVLGMVVYREIPPHEIPRLALRVVENTAMIMFIVTTASVFGWILAREQIPQAIAAFFLEITRNPVVMLLILNVLFLILGMFMETLAIMLIFLPIVIPIVQALGIDLVHFGVVFVLNVMIGLLTPPFGMLLFLMSGLTKLPMAVILQELVPYIVVLVGCLFLITLVPPLVMFLPGLGR